MSKTPVPKFGMMPWGKQIIALQSAPLPVLYFDGVACLSHMNGIIGVTLTVTGNVPTGNGGSEHCGATAAFLKCNIPAAQGLIDALQKAILIATPVANEARKAN
jgi:hypothetical protein